MADALERAPNMRREERARRFVPLHGRERRGELACGEGLQGAKARGEFRRGQASLAVESAQKVRGWPVALARVAFDTAGNQVAVGMASGARPWDDVVEALHAGGSAAETVKAGAAFARHGSKLSGIDLGPEKEKSKS